MFGFSDMLGKDEMSQPLLFYIAPSANVEVWSLDEEVEPATLSTEKKAMLWF